MSTTTPRASLATSAERPSRSPLAGAAPPERDTRAVTTTRAAPDRRSAGVIACVSSRTKSYGNCATVMRRTASGAADPAAARAKMNTVSSGLAAAASAGARRTVPRSAGAAPSRRRCAAARLSSVPCR